MRNEVCLVSIALAVALSSGKASGQDYAQICASVYQNAVRNFSLDQQTEASLSYYYNLHCEENGEVRRLSGSASLGFTIEAIPFDFSADASSDEERMQQFCRAGFEQNGFSSASTTVRDVVVSDALDSFNQCMALSTNGIVITHQEAEPYSVTVIGRLTSTGLDARLESVTYDSDDMTCTSNSFSEDLSQIVLDGTQGYELDRDFVITCIREGVEEADQVFFPRTTLQLATNFGPYTIVLDPDAALGFNLATRAQVMYETAMGERNELRGLLDSATAEITNLTSQNSTLRSRLANPNISIHTFGTGEYDRTWFRPRHDPRWGPSPEERADALCGDAHHELFLISDRAGDCCGYAEYVVACVSN